MVDRPWNPPPTWSFSFGNTRHVTICAVCQKADVKTKVYDVVILGCISFEYYDEVDAEYLKLKDGTILKGPRTQVKNRIPAAKPDKVWAKALKDWNAFGTFVRSACFLRASNPSFVAVAKSLCSFG